MICPNCQKEIPEGTIYCEHCGQEIQIVPDYNVLEDDVLPQILEEKPKPESDMTAETSTSAKPESVDPKKPAKVKKSGGITSGRIAIFAIATCVMITIGIVIYSVTDSYLHSFGYIAEQARLADEEKRYESAIGYYEKLLEMEPDSIDLKFALGSDLYKTAEYDRASELLKEVIEADSNNSEAFEMLVKIYDQDRDYESMELLITKTDNKDILALIDQYLILPPAVNYHGGEYDDDLLVELSSKDGYEIRYTLDDTDPAQGEVYEEAIPVTDGTTILRAVCITEKGKAGFETKEEYTVHYESPEMPIITPESGAYAVPIPIEIDTLAKNADIYYAWDDDNPTIYSNKYYGPIEMPVGNHILSVIVINSHGLSSDVLRCNYDYEPTGAVAY